MLKMWTTFLFYWVAIIIAQSLLASNTFAQVSSQKSDSLWKKAGTAEIEYFYNQHGLIKAVTNYSFQSASLNMEDLSRYRIRRSRPVQNYEIVIAQASREEYGPYEGSIPTLTAEAFLVRDGSLEKPLWKLSEKAHVGEVKQVEGAQFYRTAYGRGSDLGTLNSLYNLFSGKEIFHYSSNLLSASIPNTMQVRLIGYNSIWNESNQLIGTLYYCSTDTILHELNFFLKNPGYSEHVYLGGALEFSDVSPTSNDRVEPKDQLRLWSSQNSRDPNSFTGFSIKLSTFDKTEVVIPIKNDDFDISNFASDIYRVERKK